MFSFFISKLLPLFLLPIGISLISFVLFVVFKKKFFIYSAFFVLCLFGTGFLSELIWRKLEYPWVRLSPSNISIADAIVVLSGKRHRPPGFSNIIEWNDPDRFLAGISLYESKKAPNIIFTGGFSPFYSDLPLEGNLYKKESQALGVPSSAILVTDKARNTLEEAIEVKKLIDFTNLGKRKKIILVTSAFHMKRAMNIFQRQGLLVEPYPVDFQSHHTLTRNHIFNPYFWFPNAENLASSSRGIRELLGRFFYNSI